MNGLFWIGIFLCVVSRAEPVPRIVIQNEADGLIRITYSILADGFVGSSTLRSTCNGDAVELALETADGTVGVIQSKIAVGNNLDINTLDANSPCVGSSSESNPGDASLSTSADASNSCGRDSPATAVESGIGTTFTWNVQVAQYISPPDALTERVLHTRHVVTCRTTVQVPGSVDQQAPGVADTVGAALIAADLTINLRADTQASSSRRWVLTTEVANPEALRGSSYKLVNCEARAGGDGTANLPVVSLVRQGCVVDATGTTVQYDPTDGTRKYTLTIKAFRFKQSPAAPVSISCTATICVPQSSPNGLCVDQLPDMPTCPTETRTSDVKNGNQSGKTASKAVGVANNNEFDLTQSKVYKTRNRVSRSAKNQLVETNVVIV